MDENFVAETPELEQAPVRFGIVDSDKCTKLNIRKAPNKSAEIVSVVFAGTVLEIDPVDFGDWYSVCTVNGIEGFCMKEFVIIYGGE